MLKGADIPLLKVFPRGADDYFQQLKMMIGYNFQTRCGYPGFSQYTLHLNEKNLSIQSSRVSESGLTLFHMGFFYTLRYGGGSFWPPWLKLEKWLKLGKRHFLAKIDCCCPLFMHLELNYYHFWPKKGQKNWRRSGFEPRHRRVPPLDCMWKKLST